MGFDTFACAVFGVLVDEWDREAMNAELANELGHDEDDSEEKAFGSIDARWAARLRKKYKAPADAGVVYTGKPDDRVGRCRTEPAHWIVGFGVLAFPRPVPPTFAKRAEWHFWVEGDG